MSLSHLLLVPFSSNLICQNFDGDYRHRTSEGRRPLLLSLRYNNHLFCHTKPKDFLTPTVKKTHTFSRREGILHKPIHHLKTAVKLSLLLCTLFSELRIRPRLPTNKIKSNWVLLAVIESSVSAHMHRPSRPQCSLQFFDLLVFIVQRPRRQSRARRGTEAAEAAPWAAYMIDVLEVIYDTILRIR